MLRLKCALVVTAITQYILLIHIFCIKYTHQDDIETIFEWKRLQFDYPNEIAREKDIAEGIYNPDVPIPMDVDAFYGAHNTRFIFVTIPKLKPGVPVTFGYISDKKHVGDLIITPFPSWDWHRNTSQCTNKFISVYSIFIDKCGYLHVLDSGNEGNGVICPPKIVKFNLNHFPWNTYVNHYYEFPSTVYKHNSVFANLQILCNVINCNLEIHAFVADTTQSSLVYAMVHPAHLSRALKFTHDSMKPIKPFTQFEILGTKFTLKLGILAGSFSAPMHSLDLYRAYAYMPLSSGYFSYFETEHFYVEHVHPNYKSFQSPATSQTAAMTANKKSIMFFANMQNTSIVCFNPFSDDFAPYIHTVYENSTTMQFVSGIKVVEDQLGHEYLWIMTNRLQKALTSGYDFNEINFRMSIGNVEKLLNNSACNVPGTAPQEI